MNKADMRNIITNFLFLLKVAYRVRSLTGKNFLHQISEILKLKFRNELGLSDYYNFRLWDDSRFTERDRMTYVGWRKEAQLDRIGNLTENFGLVNDKFIFYGFVEKMDLPCPELYAVYSKGYRNFGNCRTLKSKDELKSYIENEIICPFFAKPVNAAKGIGASGVRSIDKEKSNLVLINGAVVDLDRYLEDIIKIDRDYLFQEYMDTEQTLLRRCGDHLTTVRFIVLAGINDVKIFRVVWKLPIGDAMVSVVAGEYSRNIVAKVNRVSGVVEKVVKGLGLEQSELVRHPETGKRILGTKLPCFEQACRIVVQGARAFPGLRIQHWDLALSHRGAVVLENNVFGGLLYQQAAGPPGVWDDEFCFFLKEIQ